MSIQPRHPIVVMYHYVWPDDRPVPGGIRPMRVSAFNAQLDWLGERYDIVQPDAFLARLDETSDRPPCMLTFDDGTRDHAEVVTPILARRNLGGLFFIVSDAARGERMPTTHLVHWLLSEDDARVWRMLREFVVDAVEMEDLSSTQTSLGDATEAQRIYHYEPPTRARIKYALNMALAPGIARAFAVQALADLGRDERSLAAEWFADETVLRSMHNAGMTLANHGQTHESLQRLGPRIGAEIDDCSRFLTAITGKRPTWWACPFGGSGASERDHLAMREAMQIAGIEAAVSTVASTVPSGCDRLAIPRVDCVKLSPSPPGTGAMGQDWNFLRAFP